MTLSTMSIADTLPAYGGLYDVRKERTSVPLAEFCPWWARPLSIMDFLVDRRKVSEFISAARKGEYRLPMPEDFVPDQEFLELAIEGYDGRCLEIWEYPMWFLEYGRYGMPYFEAEGQTREETYRYAVPEEFGEELLFAPRRGKFCVTALLVRID